ncbi:Uncharacterized mitochondrial protein AtMg01410, partial [Striga hermonthica]
TDPFSLCLGVTPIADVIIRANDFSLLPISLERSSKRRFGFSLGMILSADPGYSEGLLGEQWCQGTLWAPRIRYPFDENKKIFSGRDLSVPPSWGRLSCSFPGAGKRRIFAICNYVNQRLLYPLHQWFMKALSMLPTDGTYSQLSPLKRLRGERESFSFDLSAETDRWPLTNFSGLFYSRTAAWQLLFLATLCLLSSYDDLVGSREADRLEEEIANVRADIANVSTELKQVNYIDPRTAFN